jgi:hypothetical protein
MNLTFISLWITTAHTNMPRQEHGWLNENGLIFMIRQLMRLESIRLNVGLALLLNVRYVVEALGVLRKLWTTGRQWKLSLAPTGSSAVSRVPLRGFPEPP